MSNPDPAPVLPEEDFKVPLLMLAVIIIPAIIALSRVEYAVELMPADRYASPHGYTWSLTLFLIPILVLGVWFLRRPQYHIERKAFWGTIGLLAPLGFGLDIFLGNSFFTFVNHGATLGLNLPGYDFSQGWRWNIPVEEFAFYFFGFIAVLLIYLWCDLFWMKSYCLDSDDRTDRARATDKLVSINFPPLWIALGLIAAAMLYKYFGPQLDHQGFPGYFTFLVLVGFVPAFVFLPVATPLINWRAFSITVFMLLLISLLWEATLAVPYQWWGYNYNQMMGLVVRAWTSLPIEATLVWLVVTWATVIIYEVMRIYFYMGRGLEALLGSKK